MAPIKCDACEQRFGKAPIEPCAVCQHWLNKLNAGRTNEAEVIAELMAENKELTLKLLDLEAKQVDTEKGSENDGA